MEQQSVKVYIYDLSRGMARSMSGAFLGKQIDGVWHTGIVVYGQEFFYGGMGVESCTPGQLPVLGQPDEIVELGKTEIPFEVFMDHLKELATTSFRATCYHLLDHNCNTFSNEVSLFLTGKPIPSKITNLPQEVMNTPLGAMLRPMIDAMQVSPGGTPMFESPVDGATGSSATAMSKPSSSDNTKCIVPPRVTENEYFPKTTFLSFDTANVQAVLGKVKEFNTKVEADLAVESDEFDLLQGLVDGSSYHSTELNTLLKLLKWPNDLLFPVLDVLRLSVRHAAVNQYLCGKNRSSEYIDLLLQQVSCYQYPANQMLALRSLCNTFLHILGKSLMITNSDRVLSLLPPCVAKANKNVQIAASSLMLNFSVISFKSKDKEVAKACIETCAELCVLLTDIEAFFRVLVCIGTLLSVEGIESFPDNILGFVQKCRDVKEPVKVSDCALYVSQLLSLGTDVTKCL